MGLLERLFGRREVVFNGKNNGFILPPNTIVEVVHPDDLNHLIGSNRPGAVKAERVQQLFDGDPINTFRVNGSPTAINLRISKTTRIILGGNSGDGCVKARLEEYKAEGYTNVIIDPNITYYEGD